MKQFFRFFAERNKLAYMISLLAIILGLSTMMTIKRDSFPEVMFGEVVITTYYPGASPEDVELKVTNKLEEEIKTVSGIQHYASWSRENVSLIHIVIDADVKDEDKVVRDIREAVTRVSDLPQEVKDSPYVKELDTSVFPVIEIGLSGEIAYSELRSLAKSLEKKLENLSGVSRVERYGYRAREISIEVDPVKAKKHEISLYDIVNTIKARNIRQTGGSFESYTSEKNIVTLAQFRDPIEVGDVVVKTTLNGPLVRVKDLAIVKDGFEEEKVISRIKGHSAISFVAFKSASADIIRVVDKIKKFVVQEEKFLPKEVRIVLTNDNSNYVRDRLSIVTNNGLIGLTLVLLVLTLFLRFRVAIWVALGVPISILGVVFLLPIFGVFLDSITMTGMVLVIGIIVDDAIIISENIYMQYEKGLSGIDAAVEGLMGVYKPVITTIMTTFIAFSPLFFMPGIMGKFVYVIPLVISLALFISLIETTLALPAHLAAGMHKPCQSTNTNSLLFRKIQNIFAILIEKILKFRYLLVFGFVLLLSSSLAYALKYMDFVLFPSAAAERFIMTLEAPPGTSLKATSDYTIQVENIVASLPGNELESFVTRIGTVGDDIVSTESENYASLYVKLTPYSDRTRTAEEIIEFLRKNTEKLKEFKSIIYRLDTGGPPVGRPIMIRVIGESDRQRNKLASELVKFLKTQTGTKDIERDDKPGKQQIEVKLNYKKMARLGITVKDVAQTIRIAYDGEIVTSVRYGDEDVDFRVIFKQQLRHNPQNLFQLQVPNKTGRLTNINDIARLKSGPGPSNYYHYNGERSITVTGDVDTSLTTPLLISKSVMKYFDMHDNYRGMRLKIGGEAEESKKSLRELLIIMAIAALGIYALLILLFNSFWQPFMVMMAVPFGIVGVIFGFAIHNETLGFLGMTGIIGLSGVVVNDSLVLVNHINELAKNKPQCSMITIVAEGAKNRLRAIILTTVSTVVGILPLAYGIGGADPFMSPMALSLGYGLMFATPMTLFLVPCFYMIGNDIQRVLQKH